MMIHAYPETLLHKAQSVLGDAFDYAINTCGIPGDDFVRLFSVSPVSGRMEIGEAAVIAGKSGIDVALDVIQEVSYGRSIEYWIGWAIAYYQWVSDRSYSEIFRAVSFSDLSIMYHTLHEADISKFVEIVDEKVRDHFSDTNLKQIRAACGCTQAELAQRSGVTLRSIQMYEQRRKDINKASAETLYRIAKTLGCRMEDLIEK